MRRPHPGQRTLRPELNRSAWAGTFDLDRPVGGADIATAHGPIRVGRVAGGARIRTGRGAIDGPLTVASGAGPVSVERAGAEVDVRGTVTLASGHGRLEVEIRAGAWMALLGTVVVRRPGEPEVYAETADLHERFAPGNPGWGHPPLEGEVRATGEGWGLVDDPGGLFGPTTVRWYPVVQWFDGDGFADLLHSTSLYRRLDRDVR